MNNLYQYLAPFLADTFGFQEVIDVTDGMGILDDCSEYRGRASRTDVAEPFMGSRMASTMIHMEDVIGGTKDKILKTFRERRRDFDPAFVMVSTSPVSLMIGTDMEDVANTISGESGLPAASVELGGHKYYDHGISETLLALGKLLVRPAEDKVPGGINLIGGNAIDWTTENVRGVRDWAEANGFYVVSQWGGREISRNLRQAAKAEVNLVTAMSGLAMAKWLEREFGTPYIAAAPFGRSWSEMIADALKRKRQPERPPEEEQANILVIGEQLMSNAIRATLNNDYGIYGVDVGTFFIFDKTLANSGDRQVKGEDGLRELLQNGGYSLIIADSDLGVLKSEGCRWIDLPHGAVRYAYTGDGVPKLAGKELNRWLDHVLPGGGLTK